MRAYPYLLSSAHARLVCSAIMHARDSVGHRTSLSAGGAAAAVADDDDDEVLSSKLLFNEESSDEKSIEKIWKSNDTESNLAETLRLLVTEIDLMVKAGLGAFNELDAANRQLLQSKELIETRSREATRINAMEDQSRASLSVRFITKFYCQKYNFLRQ